MINYILNINIFFSTNKYLIFLPIKTYIIIIKNVIQQINKNLVAYLYDSYYYFNYIFNYSFKVNTKVI